MDQRAVVAIAVAASVAATAGIMYAAGFDGQGQPAPRDVPQEPAPQGGPGGGPAGAGPPSDAPSATGMQPAFPPVLGGTDEIRRISSHDELAGLLRASELLGGGEWFPEPRLMAMESVVFSDSVAESAAPVASAPAPPPSPAKSQGAGGGSADYSTTNVQVAGVDEPDYLKNDGRYVYMVSGNTLTIIDAYPAEDADIVLRTVLDVEDRHIENMFLNGDRLVIFHSGYGDRQVIPEFDFVPRDSYDPVTHALLVDVADRSDPEILHDYSIDGGFKDARMIGGHAYFVTGSHVDHAHPRFPAVMQDGVPVAVSGASYFDGWDLDVFNTLTAIDVTGGGVSSESFLMGGSGTFYVSEDSFYLAYQQHRPLWHHESSRDRFFEAIVPLLPEGLRGEIAAIRADASLSPSRQWAAISGAMQDAYNAMGADEREALFGEIREAVTEYDREHQADARRTVIHKIAIDGPEFEYVARGSVPGWLLNQFSMDERGDRFRVATTVDLYTQFEGLVRSNAVYVLDGDMKTVGGLDGIAPDESIFSARFMDERLYLVTFRQTDPFFVIDLSSDTPRVLGELKLPGFSDYLHPYGGDHVIGLGRDATDEGRQLGVKLALFDVSDVTSPRVADDVVIGDRSAYSEAEHDHKAFFFDRAGGTLSVPVTGDADKLAELPAGAGAARGQWGGFYVFDLSGKEFDLRGTIGHYEGGEPYGALHGARTFHIGDVLYTASRDQLRMNALGDLAEINTVGLGGTGGFIGFLGE